MALETLPCSSCDSRSADLCYIVVPGDIGSEAELVALALHVQRAIARTCTRSCHNNGIAYKLARHFLPANLARTPPASAGIEHHFALRSDEALAVLPTVFVLFLV